MGLARRGIRAQAAAQSILWQTRRHVHMCLAIPPSTGGFGDRVPEGRALSPCRLCGKGGMHFWARGYAVSTVRFELEQVRQYIREQDHADGTSRAVLSRYQRARFSADA